MFRCGLRLCAVALAGLFGFVLTAGPAMAGDDYTPPTGVEVEDDTVDPGDPGDPTVLGTAITRADPAVGSNALPKTGSSSTEPLVRTGAVLVVAGAAVVYAVRRRQNATTGT